MMASAAVFAALPQNNSVVIVHGEGQLLCMKDARGGGGCSNHGQKIAYLRQIFL